MIALETIVRQRWDYNRIDNAYIDGIIDDETYEGALWLWRNAAVRYSNLAAKYEGTPPPTEEAGILFEKMKQGLC